jgi:hypothetical protein
MCDIDDIDNTRFALTWLGPGGHQYWSLHKGWTPFVEHAWMLSAREVDTIESDERLQSKLPQHKERKDGANWEPVSHWLHPLRPGVTYDDELN